MSENKFSDLAEFSHKKGVAFIKYPCFSHPYFTSLKPNSIDRGENMKTVQKIAYILSIGVMIAFAMAALAVPNSVKAASNTAILGGINIDGYCRAAYSYYPYLGRAVLMGNNAYSWKCEVKRYNGSNKVPMFSYAYVSIDLNAACRWQYGGNAYAITNNSSNPYSWACYR